MRFSSRTRPRPDEDLANEPDPFAYPIRYIKPPPDR
jgi:hypothetical protein